MTTPYSAKTYYQGKAVAARYDSERFSGLKGRLVDWLEGRLLMRSLAGLPRGARVLDLPVGTGRMTHRLRAAGYRVAGADISTPMLRQAAAGGARDLVRAEGERLPFADKSFDAVVCFRLLPHLPPAARLALLREMGRIAGDRVVAVYQPHKLALWWLANGLLLGKPVPTHFASHEQLEREFAQCGLAPQRSHTLLRGAFMERAYVLQPVTSADV